MRIPGILYGTAWKKDETARLVSAAIGQGFRGFDTACQPKHYDEAGVGAGVADGLRGGPHGALTRADLFLQTKFTAFSGQDPKRVPYDPAAPLAVQVAQSFDASLRNLQTEYVDSLILHSPLASAELTLEVWRAFERLVDSGRVRQLGLSNCAQLPLLEGLYGAARIKPAIIQNRYYAATGYDRELRRYCRRHQIVYQSFWTLTANPQLLGDSAITTLASKYHRTPAQILFRFLTQNGIVPLTGTRSETHMREDLAIFEFELTEPECRSLEALC